MKTFTADSSIASDVIPSANFSERANGRWPDMIVQDPAVVARVDKRWKELGL